MTQAQEQQAQHYCLFETALGTCGVAWSEHGLTRVNLPERDRAAIERRLQAGKRSSAEPPAVVRNVIAALQRYMAGTPVAFDDVLIDWTGVDDFRRDVYDAARKVGWGETVTYGELAKRAGYDGQAQEVGQAMARNPVPVVMPCHRVLASGGKLGGFSAYGGTLTKERLLILEGVGSPRLPGL
ncbi:MAG TPA: methylated-DNA--[protein]-cysteine S-methyltransferase [Pseudolabrys sp.]|nr:methylated-DNA--[protein]-cysteine S-methyltransferase [Pseudolabrys sp.]